MKAEVPKKLNGLQLFVKEKIPDARLVHDSHKVSEGERDRERGGERERGSKHYHHSSSPNYRRHSELPLSYGMISMWI